MSTKEKRAVILAALSGCMWGSIGLFVHKLGMYGIGSMPMTAGRYLVAVVLVGIVLGAGLLFHRIHLFLFHAFYRRDSFLQFLLKGLPRRHIFLPEQDLFQKFCRCDTAHRRMFRR